MEKTKYNKVPLPDFPMMNFFISNNQYSKWFKNTYEVLYKTSIVDIPGSMTHCEKLFDKNGLPIKKLVKDIGNLHFIDEKVRKSYFLYDDSNLITNIFFTELNKKNQSYGMISLEYSKDNKSLINSKYRLKFNVFNDIWKEYLTLQLEDILAPKEIETVASKITSFSILATKNLSNMKVVDEFKIEGFQNFQQYLKINPINHSNNQSGNSK